MEDIELTKHENDAIIEMVRKGRENHNAITEPLYEAMIKIVGKDGKVTFENYPALADICLAIIRLELGEINRKALKSVQIGDSVQTWLDNKKQNIKEDGNPMFLILGSNEYSLWGRLMDIFGERLSNMY